MNATLLGAIYAAWTIDPGITSAGWQLFVDEAPEGYGPGSTNPQAVLVEEFREKERLVSFKGDKFYEASWVFVAYVIGTAAAESLAAVVRAAFDKQPLSVANKPNLLTLEVDYTVKLDRTRSTAAMRVSEVRLAYRSVNANAA